MNLKSISSILILALSCYTFATEKREVEVSDYWQIISSELDTTLDKGYSKVKVVVLDKNSLAPLKEAKVFINTNLLVGQTDSSGTIEGLIPFGTNRFCADTKEGNSFTTNYTFLDQYSYVVQVVMNQYKQTVIDINSDVYPVAEKPVIYLYPSQTQKINIKVTTREEFTFTYPSYPSDGWSVVVNPDEKIECNDRTYNYLFWEAPIPNKSNIDMTEGFIVSSDTVVRFLEHTLSQVGLSDIEQADFITYWAPRLEQNELNFIHFEFNEGYEKYISNMKISPQPDQLIRVFMVFKPINLSYSHTEQKTPSYYRKGFTVVEWGGSQF